MIIIKEPPEQPAPPPVQPPKTTKATGNANALISWLRSNALLLALLSSQAYTLTLLDGLSGDIDRLRFYVSDAGDFAHQASISADMAAGHALDAAVYADGNSTKLIEIASGLMFNQYTVQCSKY